MNKKIGFIAAGKMASSIMKGIYQSSNAQKYQICTTDTNIQALNNANQKYGAKIFTDLNDLINYVDIIMICTKPFIVKDIVKEIKNNIKQTQLIISIAAGISIKTIENILQKNIAVVRVMPNTPALIGEGISALAKGSFVSKEQFEISQDILSKVGKVVEVNEEQIDAVTGVSGSGPAYFYYIINEIAKAGEKLGLDYKTALELSSQTALGSAKMILQNLESDKNCVHSLINNVTTKGGCTEVGNTVLQKSDISNILFDTIQKTAIKAQQLGS